MMTRVWRAFFHAGSLERGHAVGDGLDAGDRGAAGRERVEHAEDPGAVEQALAGR